MTELQPKSRIASVDILRGLVMIVMALDHVRDFWSNTPFRPEDPTQTTTLLFFTRFVTHFCAPTFSFLCGISICFVEERKKIKSAVSVFLLKRGAWLAILQVVVITFLLQFSYNVIILEVIWVLGWSMILMAGLIWLPRWAIVSFATIVIAGHNLLPTFQQVNASNFIVAILHNSPTVIPGMPTVVIAYTIFPWVGVMALGYALGGFFKFTDDKQRYYWKVVGAGMLIAFLIVRYSNIYGDPVPWTTQDRGSWFTFLSFLNVAKYPPSLSFLLLTLGVAFLLLSILEDSSSRIVAIIKTFGEVPFFFFLIHIPLISIGAHAWIYASFGKLASLAFQSPDQWPQGYEPSMLRTYVVWIIYLVILYFPCRWYARYKRTHSGWWQSYL